MNARTDQLLNELLALPSDERTEVAIALLESLETEDTPGVSDAWREEIRRRKAEIASGKAKFSPWSEVKSRILAVQ